jgi:hypothetical protein
VPESPNGTTTWADHGTSNDFASQSSPTARTLEELVALDDEASSSEAQISALHEAITTDHDSPYFKWLDRTHIPYNRGVAVRLAPAAAESGQLYDRPGDGEARGCDCEPMTTARGSASCWRFGEALQMLVDAGLPKGRCAGSPIAAARPATIHCEA